MDVGMTNLSFMSVSASFATEVLTTHTAADVILAFNLVEKQTLIVIKILVADTAIIMVLILMYLQVSLLLKALSAVIIMAWESAGPLG